MPIWWQKKQKHDQARYTVWLKIKDQYFYYRGGLKAPVIAKRSLKFPKLVHLFSHYDTIHAGIINLCKKLFSIYKLQCKGDMVVVDIKLHKSQFNN